MSMILISARICCTLRLSKAPTLTHLSRVLTRLRRKDFAGVVKVVTGKDFPHHFGLYMQDRYIFPQDRVRFVGEQVAAVIARDLNTAKKAAELVKVEYEPLPAIFDPVEALRDDAPRIHQDLGDYSHVPWFFPQGGSNIAHLRKVRKGNIEQGFAEADLVLEDTYRVPRYAHCCIEVHGATGLYDHAGRLTVWSASQSPHTQRHIFAEVLAPLGLKHQNVRVITPYVGGGFGRKSRRHDGNSGCGASVKSQRPPRPDSLDAGTGVL